MAAESSAAQSEPAPTMPTNATAAPAPRLAPAPQPTPAPQSIPASQPAAAPVSASAESEPQSEPAPVAPVKRLSGIGSIADKLGTISIKSTVQDLEQRQSNEASTRMEQPLTNDTISLYWQRLIEVKTSLPERILNGLREARPQIDGDMIIIHTKNAYLGVELRPYMVELLEWMRKASGMPDLNSRVEVEYEEQKVLVYSATDKYQVMSDENPQLHELRKLLPDIDM